MKKWKDIPRNEKWMIIIILILLIGVLIRWAAVKEGIGRGFRWYDSGNTEETDSLRIEVPESVPESVPEPGQPEILLVEPEE